MVAANLRKISLQNLTLDEILYNSSRALHRNYTTRGRFGDIELSQDEIGRLAQIHAYHTENTPIPVTVVHGISPRSGTNYVADLLRVHPDLTFLPDAMPEIPFLSLASNSISFQEQFLQRYRGNERSMDRLDSLSHFAHGAMLKPHADAKSRNALFKVPHAHHLNLFSALFPSYKLIICVRDGRDVVSSSVKTWKGGFGKRNFVDYAREWARAARKIKSAMEKFDAQGFPYKLVRYEDAFDTSLETTKELAEFIGLPSTKLTAEHFEDMSVRGSSEGGKSGVPDWSRDNVKRDENFKPVGRWASWSTKQKQQFDRIAGAELEFFGYERQV